MPDRDSAELRTFVEFLRSCESAIAHNENRSILIDGIENQIHCQTTWLVKRQVEPNSYPVPNGTQRISVILSHFLSMEASIACNSIISYQALRQSEFDKAKLKSQIIVASKNHMVGAKSFTTSTSQSNIVTCAFCKKMGHGLHKYCEFLEK